MLLGMGILVLGLVGAMKYKENMEALRAEKDKLASQAMLAEASPEQYKVLEKRRDYIRLCEEKSPPRKYSEAETELEKFVEQNIKNRGGTEVNVRAEYQSETGATYRVVRVIAEATATQDQIVQWLVDVHKPSSLRAVRTFKTTPSKVEGKVKCLVVIEQQIRSIGE